MKSAADSHAYVDAYTAVASRKSAELGRPVRCGKGCFWCCKEPVYAERREAVHIVEHVLADARTELVRLTQAWWDKFFARGFNRMPPPAEIVGFETIGRYRAENLWCPLLKDGLCSVYEQRPTACRYHLAVGSPKRCESDSKRPRQVFLHTEDHERVNLRALDILADAPLPLFQFDHLGIWLGHLLLGKTERSEAGSDVQITQSSQLITGIPEDKVPADRK